MFKDRAIVTFSAGKGGDGCISFKREKFLPRGGPDGGDGGDGGDIILISKKNTNSLIDFKGKNTITSEKGGNGSGSNKKGKSGNNTIILVPPGTIVKTFPDEKLIFDFNKEDIEFLISKGGKGGAGNSHFKSSINQAPRIAKMGGMGESIKVVLELKLIAFAGLVGLPNAGKSTLLSQISSAKPKIADYPFTTLTPNLGVVYSGYNSMVIADIPGIIEGAHNGEGMGLNFLRHIERNKILIFVIDISTQSQFSPQKTFNILKKELKYYKNKLVEKKFMIVANKKDLLKKEEITENLMELRDYCLENRIELVEISAVKGTNLNLLKNRLFSLFHEN